MVQPWVLYSLVFAAVFMAVQFVYLYMFREVRPRRKANKRLADIDSGAYRPDKVAVVLKSRRAGIPSFLSGLATLVVQTGMRDGGRKLVTAFVAAYALSLLASTLFLPLPLALPAALAMDCVMLYAFLLRKRSKRIQQFAEQLPDVLDVIVRSLKAGHPFVVSMNLVAKEMPDPSGTEFGLVSDEITYGRDVSTALDNLLHRVGYEDLRFFTTAVSIQVQTGGNLGEILGRLSKLMRDRFKMKRKIRSLSSEGRFSAIALTVFPFFLFGMMNLLAPQLYGSVWGTPAVNFALAGGAVLLVTGNVVMWRMVNFKV